MTEKKPTLKEIDLGATGLIAAANIERFRKEQGLNYKQLSEKLHELKHEIPPLGLRRIEARARRISVDDLMALSVALNVSPLDLILPNGDSPANKGTALPKELSIPEVRAWAKGDTSLNLEDRHRYWSSKVEQGAKEYSSLLSKEAELNQVAEEYPDNPGVEAAFLLNKERLTRCRSAIEAAEQIEKILKLELDRRYESGRKE